jgi:TonB family protein
MTYGHPPLPCIPEKNGEHASVLFARKLPIVTNHPGSLKILDILDGPMPPYPQSAREAGKEGNLKLFLTVGQSGEVLGVRVLESVDDAIDEAAVETLRTWKFRISQGEDAGFALTISYRLGCDASDDDH